MHPSWHSSWFFPYSSEYSTLIFLAGNLPGFLNIINGTPKRSAKANPKRNPLDSAPAIASTSYKVNYWSSNSCWKSHKLKMSFKCSNYLVRSVWGSLLALPFRRGLVDKHLCPITAGRCLWKVSLVWGSLYSLHNFWQLVFGCRKIPFYKF